MRADEVPFSTGGSPPSVLLCACAERQRFDASLLRRVRERLEQRGAAYRVVPDLCQVAVRQPGLLREWLHAEAPVVAACHPRAVTGLLEAAGVNPGSAICVDLLENDALEWLEKASDGAARGALVSEPGPETDWPAWFPVIDRSRCVDCGQCLSFCLFGVYERDVENRVVVANPTRCKFNCPACSRVCPELAVMFPKLAEEPYNGGEPAASAKGEDFKALESADLYALLRSRQELRRRRLLKKSAWRKAGAAAKTGSK